MPFTRADRERLAELTRLADPDGAIDDAMAACRENLSDAEWRELVELNDKRDGAVAKRNGGRSVPETRMVGGSPADSREHRFGPEPEIQGRPDEILSPRASMTEWTRRAAENGVHYGKQGADRKVTFRDNDYVNAWWGQKLGIATRESRALAEDTSGSGLAVTPQSWTSQVVDYLYADAVVGQLGVSRVALPTEIHNMPVLTAPAAPAWLAENASIGLDTNPAFSSLQFNAQGGWKDITNFSIELAQDAYVAGSLPSFLAQTVARNLALAVDAAAIFGVAGNSGNPGLNSESGFNIRHYTGDSGTTGATVSDTTELSVINEKIRNANAHNEGYLTNPSVDETLARTTSGTFPMFWPLPRTVADIPIVTTANASVVPTTETDPATASTVAQTGGSYSSIYAGPWSYMMLGVHLDLSTRTLTERYADLGQVGLFSVFRASIRTAHPSAFYRTIGLKTT